MQSVQLSTLQIDIEDMNYLSATETVISKEMKHHTPVEQQMVQNAKLSMNLLESAANCGRHSPADCLFFPLQVFSSVVGTQPRGEGVGVVGGRRCVFGQLVASAQCDNIPKQRGQ